MHRKFRFLILILICIPGVCLRAVLAEPAEPSAAEPAKATEEILDENDILAEEDLLVEDDELVVDEELVEEEGSATDAKDADQPAEPVAEPEPPPTEEADASKDAPATPAKQSAQDEELIVDDGQVVEEEEPSVEQKGRAKPGEKPVVPPVKVAEEPAGTTKDVEEEVSEDILEERELLFEAGEEKVVAEEEKEVVEEAPEVVAEESATSDSAEDGVLVEEDELLVEEETVEGKDEKAEDDEGQQEPPKVVTLEDERSINFAEGLKEYRSPKLAMLLSLIVPGLGQAYVGRYWKTGVYLAVEAGVIAASIAFYQKGKFFAEEARAHADTTYSYDSLRNHYEAMYQGIYDKRNDPTDTAYVDSILRWEVFGIWDSNLIDSAYFRTEYYDKKSDEYYRLLEDDMFVQGWKDAKPRPTPEMIASENTQILDPNAFGFGPDTVIRTTPATADSITYKFNLYTVSGGDTTLVPGAERRYGFSKYYDVYTGLLSERNRRHRVAGSLLYVVILNHIISAIDAGITAKRHNDRLLSKESFWQRIEVEPQFVNTGTDFVPGVGLTISF